MNRKYVFLVGGLSVIGLGLGGLSSAPAASGSDRKSVAGPRTADVRGTAIDASPPAVAAAVGGCVTLPAQDWFGAIRPLPDCLGNSLFRRTGPRDINRDGIEEIVEIAYESVSTNPPQNICLAERFEIDIDGGSETTIRQCVLSSLEIMAYLQSVAGPGGTGVIAFPTAGWHDVDRDGDLDLCVIIDDEHRAWIENTGFEATQPLTGDLNADGNVDSADLTILLGGWTGS